MRLGGTLNHEKAPGFHPEGALFPSPVSRERELTGRKPIKVFSEQSTQRFFTFNKE